MANTFSTNKNPWNGLRTYHEGEIIYGRSEEIQILSMMILQSQQTVVYGRSGIGKSSIINAGIFPIVRKKGVFPVYIRLEHNSEKSYLEQIRDSIFHEVNKSNGNIVVKHLIDAASISTLWEFFHGVEYLYRDGNILRPMIVFDQFEEIFTLETDKNKVNTFFRELADLINNVMPEESSAVATSIDASDYTQLDDALDLSLDKINSVSFSYKTTADYHLVFSLREDFLSYLERNTTDIPALKNNRYCLQPINEEQAAEIIMQPRPGLVDINVAKLIIEKVTGEVDFEINGVPEIQVDSAILSLYMSRLYDKMISVNEEYISSELVEVYSANIIEDFYNDAIKGLPEKSVQWLEETLINEDGRRDNRDKSTVIRESGLSKKEVNRLINDVKLLRQFSYGGNLRIEYIHDVICPVIIRLRQKRMEQKVISELHRKSVNDKRRILFRTICIAGLIVLAVIGIAVWAIKAERSSNLKDQQNVVISLLEDSSVNDMDFWKTTLTVKGFYNSGKDTVILKKIINKAEISTPIAINIDTCAKISVSLNFGDFAEVGKYINRTIEIPAGEVAESPVIQIPVSRDIPKLTQYQGRIILDIENVELPVENAVVLMGDYVAISDSMGYFNMSLEQLPDESTMIMLAKGGVGCFELQAKNKSDEINLYKVFPPDSLRYFNTKINELDTVTRWNYSTVGKSYCANYGAENGIYIKFSDGHEDRLKMYWKKGEPQGDKVPLTGYFYFKNEKEQLDAKGKGKYSYYLGTGYIDRYQKKDENNINYRNFEFKGYDAASNVRTVSGRYYVARGLGKYTGDITSRSNQIGTFGHSQ